MVKDINTNSSIDEYKALNDQLLVTGTVEQFHNIVTLALSTETMSEEEAKPIRDEIMRKLEHDEKILKRMKQLYKK